MSPSLDQFGNVMPAPGYQTKAEVKPDEILYSYAGFTQKGVTLAGGQGILPGGTVLARKTSNKRWYVYTPGASDGTQVPRGFLRQRVDTGKGAESADMLGNIVLAGFLRNSTLSGVDSTVLSTLNARQDTVLDYLQF